MRKRTTVGDVALEAGVSKSTVSFVMNKNRPISKEVTERVMKAVHKLNYSPNKAAQMLSAKNNRTIGILIETCNDAFTGVMLEEINQNLLSNKYQMHLAIAGQGKENAIKAISNLASGGIVGGIINMLPELSISETIKYCNSVPTVTYLRPQVNSPVYLDFISGIKDAMDYLWGLGHRDIGFIGIEEKSTDLNEDGRLTGFKQYLTSKNVEIDHNKIVMAPGLFESGISASERLYSQGVTAILCANDQIATGVLYWCHENKVDVPSQLSVVGFDDSPIASIVYPALTTVQIPARELAAITVKGIIDKMNGKIIGQHQVLKPRLIVRKSATRPAIK